MENHDTIFKNPPSRYRGAPFWAWNSVLDKETLQRQIEVFREMGLGGFHMHPRAGLRTEYLGDEFMELVKFCNEKAKELDMQCYLYDEDRWPSGFAGGLVTKEKRYRQQYLILRPENSEPDSLNIINRTPLARYSINIRDSFMTGYKRLTAGEDAEAGGAVWIAELGVAGDNPRYNNQAYVDVMSKEAIDRFIEITFDKYYDAVGGDFGKSVPAIFTDEPQVAWKDRLGFADEQRPIVSPFTGDFDETFYTAYGISILDHFPEVIWERCGYAVSKIRYLYHKHINERFAEAFSDNIGGWCGKHNIKLTGHMMTEENLSAQTFCAGEIMRHLSSFQLPGIDMLCDRYELTTAKQAQSVSRQYGRSGVMSELYGVTNWDFDFRGHKTQGDWQAALGVTLRVHHLTWVSMNGEAKRDYPASIGEQSPWYKEYPYIEDHFARLNTALTQGKPVVRVGMIHPVESAWLYFGTHENTDRVLREIDSDFERITKWLVHGLIDFDYISESLLPELTSEEASFPLRAGEMEYEAIIVPSCATLRETTYKRLKSFKKAGGKVIITGRLPEYVDAEEPADINVFVRECKIAPLTPDGIINAIEEYRDVNVFNSDKTRADGMAYQMRENEDGSKWLFVCNAAKTPKDVVNRRELTVVVKGAYNPVVYNTITGEITPASAEKADGQTFVKHTFFEQTSLLLKLNPAMSAGDCLSKTKSEHSEASCIKTPEHSTTQTLSLPASYVLSEPNCAILDVCEYAFDDGVWQPAEEVLRIDNEFRRRLGLPLRRSALAQPWVREEKDIGKHTLRLRFTIDSLLELSGCSLALENSENTEIVLNGETVKSKPAGFFTDRCIKTIPLPSLRAGKNELVLTIDYNDYSDVEWCYLLGNFGVDLAGRRYTLTALPECIAYGDFTRQKLPFYAGNLTYISEMELDAGHYELEVPFFRAPLLRVAVDGGDKGIIALSPYKLDLGELSPGKHTVSITSYGNRVNAFGALHNSDPELIWYGPDSWRTEGSFFAYEYQIRPMGVLTSPVIARRLD